MTHQATISSVCQRLLEEQRGALNARFRQSQAVGARVEPAEWLAQLQTCVLPLVDAVHRVLPERCGLVLRELYDIALELKQCGAWCEPRDVASQALQQLWLHVLPRAPKLLAQDPRGVAGSLSNAALALARVGQQEVLRWLESMERLAERTATREQLLQLGQVAAWTSGLPEYRAQALRLAEKLPHELLQILFQLAPDSSSVDLPRLLQRWSDDPWFNCTSSAADHSRIQLMQICGSFRGFGGKFLFPPRVFVKDQQLLVSDQQVVWRLISDLFGHSIKRTDLPPPQRFATRRAAGKIDAQGRIVWDGDELHLPHLAASSSQACDGQTLAVTLPDSFHVYLFARPESLWEK